MSALHCRWLARPVWQFAKKLSKQHETTPPVAIQISAHGKSNILPEDRDRDRYRDKDRDRDRDRDMCECQ